MEPDLGMKTTFDGRWTLMENNFWQKPTFNRRWPFGRQHLMEDDLWQKTTFDGRQPLTEDDLWWNKIFTTYIVQFLQQYPCPGHLLFTCIPKLLLRNTSHLTLVLVDFEVKFLNLGFFKIRVYKMLILIFGKIGNYHYQWKIDFCSSLIPWVPLSVMCE